MPTKQQTMTPIILSRTAQDLVASKQRIESDDLRPIWERAVTRVQTDAQDLTKQEVRIDTNVHLSPEGKRQELAKIAQSKVATVHAIKKERTVAMEAVQRLRADLLDVPKSEETDRVLDFLMSQEIRRSVEGKSQAEIMRAFEAAVTSGNVMVQRSFMTGPTGTLLDKDIARRVLEAHARTTRRAEFNRLTAMTNLAEHLASLEEHAAMWLRNLGADPDKA